MTPSDGDPAEPWDVWTRVITNQEYWKKDGTLHNSAFSGKGAIAVPETERPWSHELSGRLLSLITNLQQESAGFCAGMNKQFAGVMFQTVENLRSVASGFPTDVVHTPSDDAAHGDVIAFGTTDEDRFILRDWLQDFIQYVRPNLLAAVEALRSNQPQ
jgi:hypothetical protein